MLNNEKNNDNKPKNNTSIDIFLANIEFIINYFEKHETEQILFNNENLINLENFQKLFHGYELFQKQIVNNSFRKRILVQILITLYSFIIPFI